MIFQQAYTGAPMEGRRRRLLAGTGELTIYSARDQAPHEVRMFCSRLAGHPRYRVRVIMRGTPVAGSARRSSSSATRWPDAGRRQAGACRSSGGPGPAARTCSPRASPAIEHGDVRHRLRRRGHDPGRRDRLRVRLRRLSSPWPLGSAVIVGVLFPGPYRVPGRASRPRRCTRTGRPVALPRPLAVQSLARGVVAIWIAGGSVYDALVGYAAKVHGSVLAMRDERARDTYRGLDVEFEFFG